MQSAENHTGLNTMQLTQLLDKSNIVSTLLITAALNYCLHQRSTGLDEIADWKQYKGMRFCFHPHQSCMMPSTRPLCKRLWMLLILLSGWWIIPLCNRRAFGPEGLCCQKGTTQPNPMSQCETHSSTASTWGRYLPPPCQTLSSRPHHPLIGFSSSLQPFFH